MRKRLIGFLLILCMMITTIMPVMAEGKDIQSAVVVYDEMKDVLSNRVGDVAALEAVFEKVVATNEELGLEYKDPEVLEEHNPEYWNVMSQAGTI